MAQQDAGAALGARPDWVDPDLFPFTSRFVEIDGNVVHYVDEGAGPTLVMLHGNPTWSFVYRDVINALRMDFRCIAVDYPGFGLSLARDGYGHLPEDHANVTAQVLDALELTDATLVCQDWGGPIGLAAALQRPGVFTRLVFGNTWAWPVNGDMHFEMFSRLMGGPIGAVLIRRRNLFVNLMIPAGHRRRKPSAAEMLHYRQALPTASRRQASAIFPREIIRSRDFLATVERGLGGLRELPALLVWADADIAFRNKELKRWESMLAHHTTVVLAGAGHYVQSDAPSEFADAIRNWFPR